MKTANRPGLLWVVIMLGVVLALAAVVTTSNTPVHANSGPDLVAGTPSMEFTNPHGGTNPFAGSQMTLSVTVTNSGDEASEATWLRGYRSTDSTITTSDTEEGGQHVGTLAAAGTSSFDHGLTTPSEAGTYYYGVCVDSVTGESDTTNNCSSSVMITVLEPTPDLVVTEIDTSNNIVTGGKFPDIGEGEQPRRCAVGGNNAAVDAIGGWDWDDYGDWHGRCTGPYQPTGQP